MSIYDLYKWQQLLVYIQNKNENGQYFCTNSPDANEAIELGITANKNSLATMLNELRTKGYAQMADEYGWHLTADGYDAAMSILSKIDDWGDWFEKEQPNNSEGDELEDEVVQARVDELQAENTELKKRLAEVEASRDNYYNAYCKAVRDRDGMILKIEGLEAEIASLNNAKPSNLDLVDMYTAMANNFANIATAISKTVI